MKSAKAILAATLAVTLASCASTFVSPVEVTRFVGSQPNLLGSGPIVVRAAPGEDQASLQNAVFQDAVAQELRQLGYTVIIGDAPQIAEVRMQRFVEQAAGRRSPVSVGVGAASGSAAHPRRGGVGVGAGVGIDLSPRPSDQILTQLRVAIRPSAGGHALWEGSASFTATANSALASEQAAATRLASALFTGFPGRSGETIQVR